MAGRPQGDALTAVQARGELRWGGDEEGGGPYIYRADDNAQVVTGFEFDLMDQLARGLGVRSRFESSNWPELLKTLHTGTVDVVVNGYELTPERLRDQIASIPYYAYELHLFARSDDATISDWGSLKRALCSRGLLAGRRPEEHCRRHVHDPGLCQHRRRTTI